MAADDVLKVFQALQAVGISTWLDGGWGIDALLGDQHRDHIDLDLVIELAYVDAATAVLNSNGYRIVEDHLPTQRVLRADGGRQVDLHPITFDRLGTGWQMGAAPGGGDCEYPAHGFTTGRVGDNAVHCLSADVQVAHHLGYKTRQHDDADG